MDGVIHYRSAENDQIIITFDDEKTDEGKIAEALRQGGVSLQGKQTPEERLPSFYK